MYGLTIRWSLTHAAAGVDAALRAYDIVFCDAARSENPDYLAAALTLLRTGGLVVFAGALAGGRVADTSARDAESVAMRELARLVREETRLVPAMIPVGTGLLAAALTG